MFSNQLDLVQQVLSACVNPVALERLYIVRLVADCLQCSIHSKDHYRFVMY